MAPIFWGFNMLLDENRVLYLRKGYAEQTPELCKGFDQAIEGLPTRIVHELAHDFLTRPGGKGFACGFIFCWICVLDALESKELKDLEEQVKK